MAFEKHQFRDLVTRTLREIQLGSPEAIDLIMGTCAQESKFGTYLRQLGGGPALGPFQIEPKTFDWLRGKYGIWHALLTRSHEELEWDIRLGIIVARLKYLGCPGPIPQTLEGQATYWNQYYNCNPKYGTEAEYLAAWKKYVA